MVRRFNRLLVVLYLLADAGLGMVAFALAYFLRFHGPIAQLIPPVKGHPPFKRYVYMLPFVAVLVPVAFHMQGLYRLRRGRTRRRRLLRGLRRQHPGGRARRVRHAWSSAPTTCPST